jgi:hypothetical protein
MLPPVRVIVQPLQKEMTRPAASRGYACPSLAASHYDLYESEVIPTSAVSAEMQ